MSASVHGPGPSAPESDSGDEEPTSPTSRVLMRSGLMEERDVGVGGVEDERLFAELRARLFSRGTTHHIGRYRIVRRLGAGAMGEVHLAVDEALDRTIAIKLVHAHLADPRWTERLRGEARALARLAHPHVVRVYEVGEHEGRTYLAMELIEGGSLRSWIEARPGPRWEQVLAAYVDAGRGLAAAHRAGVVHRDFKPDNVLRGSDGRVAVVDFGLAALELEGGTPSLRATDEVAVDTATLRPTSEIAGTPAYMPPEQFQGRSDARGDQFSLCVALYEGLWGRRPFAPHTIAQVLEGRADWEPAEPGSGAVPRWLWPIVRRGLEVEPQRRFDDVDELLAAIEAGLRRGRRRRRLAGSALGALGVALLSGTAVAWWGGAAAVDECAALERELHETWSPERRGQLQRRFAGAGGGARWLVESEVPVAAGLDQWRARWLEARGELCRARAGGDPVVLDRQGRCLDRHRRATQAVVDALLGGEPGILREAPEAVQRLDDPRSCEREARQGGPPEPPAAVVDGVERVRQQLAVVEAELLTGQVDGARARAAGLEAQAQALDHAPLAAELALLQGRIALAGGHRQEGLERLELAADTAEAALHDRVVARSWQHMAMAAATEAPDLEAGRRWLRRAEAASARVGLDPHTGARLEYIRGNLRRLAKDLDAAIEQLGRAGAALEREGDLLYASYAASNLGLAWLERGEAERALEGFERALDQRERVFGPWHPEVAQAAFDLAQAIRAVEPAGSDHGELAGALLRRAVEIWTGTDDASSLDAGRAALVLAQLELDAGRFESGLVHAREAAAVFGRTLDADRLEQAEAAALVATSLYFLGRPQPAIVAFRQAVAGYAAAHGMEDVYTAYFRVSLGWALLAGGEVAQARAELEAGLAVIEAHAGADREPSTDARLGLAAVELAEGAPLRAAARVVELGEEPAGELDRVTFALVSGLVAVRRDPSSPEGAAWLARARAHAKAVAGGEAMLEVLLDSLRASPTERRLAER